jgi:hypothetical protein
VPRIRSIHPEQWTDDQFVTCEPLARLLALGLRNEADDNGIFDWNPIKLKMRLLPADNCDVTELLGRLEATGQIIRFTDEASGKPYGMIRNFQKYQKPKKPSFTRPVPSGPLPSGYSLSPAYRVEAASETSREPPGAEPVRHRFGNRPAEGSGGGSEEGENSALRPAPVSDLVRTSPIPDNPIRRRLGNPPAEGGEWENGKPAPAANSPLLEVLLQAGWSRVQAGTPKAIALLRRWQTDGVSVATLTEAVALAKRRCGALPNSPAYLRGIVDDLVNEHSEESHGNDNGRSAGATHCGLGAKDYTEGAAQRLEDLPWTDARLR